MIGLHWSVGHCRAVSTAEPEPHSVPPLAWRSRSRIVKKGVGISKQLDLLHLRMESGTIELHFIESRLYLLAFSLIQPQHTDRISIEPIASTAKTWCLSDFAVATITPPNQQHCRTIDPPVDCEVSRLRPLSRCLRYYQLTT